MKKTNITLSSILLILIIVIFFVQRNYSNRNLEFMPDMINSVAYNSQSNNPNFTDNLTSRKNITGTISRGFEKIEFNTSAEGAKEAGVKLRNPLIINEENVNLGGKKFATFCQPCHGAAGLGDGAVALRGFPAPPSLIADRAMSLKDGEIFHIMTYGQNNMPALAAQVSKEERWQIIQFVRQIQKQSGK